MTPSQSAVEAAIEEYRGGGSCCAEDAMRAALEAVLAVDGVALQGWQPIESAPKDGRYLVVARFRQDELKWVKHSRWMTADEVAEQECGEPADFEAGWTDGDDEHDYCYPTHWQPLPTPPTKDNEK